MDGNVRAWLIRVKPPGGPADTQLSGMPEPLTKTPMLEINCDHSRIR